MKTRWNYSSASWMLHEYVGSVFTFLIRQIISPAPTGGDPRKDPATCAQNTIKRKDYNFVYLQTGRHERSF